MRELSTFKLIDRITTLLRSEERKRYLAMGLQPIHVQILEYLAQCNRLSDTPAAVTEYFGLTKGTVSQSLQVLERKGYIEKTANPLDRRILHLNLSPEGHDLLDEILGIDMLPHACKTLNDDQFEEINKALNTALIALQAANNLRSFGVCHTCKKMSEVDNHYLCELTQEPLSRDDTMKICREHVLTESAD
jgi:MarR family transcriptional regulator, negative regulator of the multidrug operon emrRAB